MMNPTTALSQLRQLRLFENISEVTLETLSQSVRLVSFRRGQTICRQNECGDAMYVVVCGRVKVTSGSEQHSEKVLRFLDRNEHFGEMSALTGSRRTANVIAVTNTHVLQVDRAAFELLQQKEPDFCAALSKTLADRLACTVRSATEHTVNRTVAVLHGSRHTAGFVFQLRDEMQTMGADVEVFANASLDSSYLPSSLDKKSRHLTPAASPPQLQRMREQHAWVLLSNTFAEAAHDVEMISRCDRILCVMDATDGGNSRNPVKRLLAAFPNLAPRVHVVTLLAEGETLGSQEQLGPATLGLDFKLPWPTPDQPTARVMGLRRIIRFLTNQRMGIALGGGGARGLAHLGVLRAFEDEGIGIDLVSGTSMGALVGLSYAAGRRPSDAETLFREELTPNRLFRMLPRGASLYMISKFRLTGWEGMLRKYFQRATFEQLQIPLCTVSADLIRGGQIIRESGDCVAAIQESINLPYIARPIVRDEHVLVDGGILNNIPVDLLRPRGANLVIGVDVCSQLPHGFGRNSTNRRLRRPTLLETAFRVNEIRRYHVSRTNLDDADHMIRIDTSRFEFEDFSKAHELAEAGYQATLESIPHIRKLVDDRLAQTLKAG